MRGNRLSFCYVKYKSEPVANRHYKVRIINKWYSRRESNPQRPLRRGLLYPFNYGSIFNFITPAKVYCMKKFIPNFIPISIFLIKRLTRLVLLYLIFS